MTTAQQRKLDDAHRADRHAQDEQRRLSGESDSARWHEEEAKNNLRDSLAALNTAILANDDNGQRRHFTDYAKRLHILTERQAATRDSQRLCEEHYAVIKRAHLAVQRAERGCDLVKWGRNTAEGITSKCGVWRIFRGNNKNGPFNVFKNGERLKTRWNESIREAKDTVEEIMTQEQRTGDES